MIFLIISLWSEQETNNSEVCNETLFVLLRYKLSHFSFLLPTLFFLNTGVSDGLRDRPFLRFQPTSPNFLSWTIINAAHADCFLTENAAFRMEYMKSLCLSVGISDPRWSVFLVFLVLIVGIRPVTIPRFSL